MRLVGTVKPSSEIVFNRQLLRLSRLRMGLTQEQLARKLDITMRAYQYWERGDGVPSGANLIRLSELLGVPTDELYVIEKAA